MVEFPCDYVFKAFGPAGPDSYFAQRVRSAVSSVAEVSLDAMKMRSSTGGKYLCVSVVVRLFNNEQLKAIYLSLGQVEGLAYLL